MKRTIFPLIIALLLSHCMLAGREGEEGTARRLDMELEYGEVFDCFCLLQE
ncbi:MAG: hypothetical protein ACI4B5_00470 [Bacteroidaceae bacterium]